MQGSQHACRMPGWSPDSTSRCHTITTREHTQEHRAHRTAWNKASQFSTLSRTLPRLECPISLPTNRIQPQTNPSPPAVPNTNVVTIQPTAALPQKRRTANPGRNGAARAKHTKQPKEPRDLPKGKRTLVSPSPNFVFRFPQKDAAKGEENARATVMEPRHARVKDIQNRQSHVPRSGWETHRDTSPPMSCIRIMYEYAVYVACEDL